MAAGQKGSQSTGGTVQGRAVHTGALKSDQTGAIGLRTVTGGRVPSWPEYVAYPAFGCKEDANPAVMAAVATMSR